jgi:hypothetical protein
MLKTRNKELQETKYEPEEEPLYTEEDLGVMEVDKVVEPIVEQKKRYDPSPRDQILGRRGAGITEPKVRINRRVEKKVKHREKRFEMVMPDGSIKKYAEKASALRHQFRALQRPKFKRDCEEHGMKYNLPAYEIIINVYYLKYAKERIEEIIEKQEELEIVKWWLELPEDEQRMILSKNPKVYDRLNNK